MEKEQIQSAGPAGTDAGEIVHRPPDDEIRFYHAVADGDMDEARKNCQERQFENMEGAGILSKDPVTNFKYHFVITASMLARICKESGMGLEQAFRLSDRYIQRLDSIDTVEGVVRLHDQMVLEYTGKMRLLKRTGQTLKPVSDCVEYVYSHIRERITVDDLADVTGVSASYLSRLFKRELGIPVSVYIREQKLRKAENLLRFSEMSLVEIGEYLSFASQSHFIQIFRSYSGMTPKKYRNTYRMKGMDHFGPVLPEEKESASPL